MHEELIRQMRERANSAEVHEYTAFLLGTAADAIAALQPAAQPVAPGPAPCDCYEVINGTYICNCACQNSGDHAAMVTWCNAMNAAPPAAAPAAGGGEVARCLQNAYEHIQHEAYNDALSSILEAQAALSDSAARIAALEGERWRPASELPEESGHYLVMLREDNVLGWTTERPVMMEWDFWRHAPKHWTGFDHMKCANVIASLDVICWRKLPPCDYQEPDTVTAAVEFLSALATPAAKGGE